jgi:hypothetical protein
LESDSDETLSSDSESELDEDIVVDVYGNVNRSQNKIWSKPHPWNSCGVSHLVI